MTTNKPERIIQREIMLVASSLNYTFWRNNTGSAWQGKKFTLKNAVIHTRPGVKIHVPHGLLLTDHRPVQFGLCEGSSDLIGLRQVTIKPEHVGQTLAVFTAIEVKGPKGRATKKQTHFIDFVTGAGGIAAVARSPEDLPT